MSNCDEKLQRPSWEVSQEEGRPSHKARQRSPNPLLKLQVLASLCFCISMLMWHTWVLCNACTGLACATFLFLVLDHQKVQPPCQHHHRVCVCAVTR